MEPPEAELLSSLRRFPPRPASSQQQQALGLCMKRCLCSQWRMLISLILSFSFLSLSLSPLYKPSQSVMAAHRRSRWSAKLSSYMFSLISRWKPATTECAFVLTCAELLQWATDESLVGSSNELSADSADWLLEQQSGILYLEPQQSTVKYGSNKPLNHILTFTVQDDLNKSVHWHTRLLPHSSLHTWMYMQHKDGPWSNMNDFQTELIHSL